MDFSGFNLHNFSNERTECLILDNFGLGYTPNGGYIGYNNSNMESSTNVYHCEEKVENTICSNKPKKRVKKEILENIPRQRTDCLILDNFALGYTAPNGYTGHNDYCNLESTSNEYNEEKIENTMIGSKSKKKGKNEKTENMTAISRPKRKREECKWKRNIRKQNRASGKSYTSVTGKIVPPKVFVPQICDCTNKCHEGIPVERQQEIHRQFYNLADFNLQSAYVFGLVKVMNKKRTYTKNTENPRRTNTRFYFLNASNGQEKQVCKTFFKKVLDISDGRISRVLQHKSAGNLPPLDKRGKHTPHNKTTEEAMQAVENFIERLPKYSKSRKGIRKYLAPGLNMTKIYNLYKEEIKDNCVSSYVFQNIFNTRFTLSFQLPPSDTPSRCN